MRTKPGEWDDPGFLGHAPPLYIYPCSKIFLGFSAASAAPMAFKTVMAAAAAAPYTEGSENGLFGNRMITMG